MAISLYFKDASIRLDVISLDGRERLGEATALDIEATSREPIEREALFGQPCLVELRGRHGTRTITGVVARVSAIATSSREAARRYRLAIRSAFSQLELRYRTKVFQHLALPEVIKSVVADGAFGDGAVQVSTRGNHPPREYLVQYAETDAVLVRRLCEDEGLYFRFEAGDEGETFILEDTSTSAATVLPDVLPLTDRFDGEAPGPTAFLPRMQRRRRPGKVTLHDHDPERPNLALQGVANGGKGPEQDVEVYSAPGRFKTEGDGNARAQLTLEALRADACTVHFGTTAFALAPGVRVDIEPTGDLRARARLSGGYFVVGLTHHFRFDGGHTLEVEAIPIDVPFRLPRVTPRPKLSGVQNAIVTGAPGEEIHVDALGRVRVHFFWDREGKNDHTSSLPIRVMQPQMPGSMLLPRVGWEVIVAFEDGDPDRPYVLGRLFNNKHPPPYSLPANKTASVIGTTSSPGGGRQNLIRFDDAAGRQIVAIGAGFGKNLTVGNNMVTQTANNESLKIKGSQTRSVGASEKVSVTQAHLEAVGSQSAMVGATQTLTVKGDIQVGVGSESVLIGGACLEKVGNPVTGALNLAKSAALAGAGALGSVGSFASAAGGLAMAGYEGYKQGGVSGALKAAGAGAVNMAADAVLPGGSTALGAVSDFVPLPWQDKKLEKGGPAGGGGAAGASDSAGPQGPGPGHRNTVVEGAMAEIIGAALGVATPGSIGWTTVGPSTLLVGGSHTVRTGLAGVNVAGASVESLGSLTIDSAGNLTRSITGALKTTVAGSLKATAGGTYSIKAGGALNIKIGGALKMKGAHVTFVVGSSKVSTSPAGVLVQASTITVTGTTKQSGPTSHS